MALIISKNDGLVKIISSKDSAVTCDDTGYEAYSKSLDESLLMLNGEPTRFVMKKGLSYKEQQIIKDAQIKMDGKKMQVSLSYMMEEVRIALVDIENPASLAEDQKILFRRSSDGKASEELVSMLESAGVVTELFTARQGSIGVLGDATKKK